MKAELGNIIPTVRLSGELGDEASDGQWRELKIDSHTGFGFLIWKMDGYDRSPEIETKVEEILHRINNPIDPSKIYAQEELDEAVDAAVGQAISDTVDRILDLFEDGLPTPLLKRAIMKVVGR